jgi:1-acyl-sn-glycerol-3-phosphate acyltransferase
VFTGLLPQLINPLTLSEQLLSTLGTQISVTGKTQIPDHSSMLIVSNHRSFMDVAVLMKVLGQPIHFACHHYMRQVPLMNELVDQLGFLPLDQPKKRYSSFFDRASELLNQRQVIGIFPEGTSPMVKSTSPETISQFQRGFAHLALRAPVENLVILPVAIAAQQELNTDLFPVRWLQLFDPSEPLFDRPDWHPLVLYHQVRVSIGTPILVKRSEKQTYRGRQALDWVNQTTTACQQEIQSLLIHHSASPL